MNLKIIEDLTPTQIKELIKFSNTDKLIQKTTRDSERFKNENAIKVWMKKDRKIFVLTNSSEKLLGIIWFGEKEFPESTILQDNFDKSKYSLTFSIRIYSEARGKGHAKSFMNGALKKYMKMDEYKKNPAKGIWLITNESNKPAIKAYQNIGFYLVSEANVDGRIIMVKD